MFGNLFFPFENHAVNEIMCKNIVQPDTSTDDNMTLAHCVLGTQSYKHTLRICNTYCFSAATVVTRTRFIVTLYLHFLPCLIIRCDLN